MATTEPENQRQVTILGELWVRAGKLCLGSLSKHVGPGTATLRSQSTGPREQRAREDEGKPGTTSRNKPGRGQCEKNHRNDGLWYVPGDGFHEQTRVEKANQCLPNKGIISRKAGEQSQASDGWCLTEGPSCVSAVVHIPRDAGARCRASTNL